MQIAYKILKVKDHYEHVLKEVNCNLRKMLNKSVKSIKKVLQVLESVENPHQPEACTMQKPANQPAMQIKWLLAQQNASPKPRGDFRTNQSSMNNCNFMI